MTREDLQNEFQKIMDNKDFYFIEYVDNLRAYCGFLEDKVIELEKQIIKEI